jgi:RNA 3'-terminal phosphate cyclase (ATP)
MIVIDGSHGEGGGQVLRTTLSLAAILGQPVRIERIRAGRKKPGLAPQHLTGVRAIARVCNATLTGATLGSQTLTFAPQQPPQPGVYSFDVTEAAERGSAGAVSLVFQTLVVPLALADGRSRLTLKGGTHVPWSPPVHYLSQVYLPSLRQLGIEARIETEKWGFYPIGGGVVRAEIWGAGEPEGSEAPSGFFAPLSLVERGDLKRVRGTSAIANLPHHIAERQQRRAIAALRRAGIRAEVEIVEAPSPGKGTCVFLLAEYEQTVAGFTGLGARGKPAEQVAQEAVDELLNHHASGAALDWHLADQLILPLMLAFGPSEFTTSQVTQHLLTNAWVAQQFLPSRVTIEGAEGEPGHVTVTR